MSSYLLAFLVAGLAAGFLGGLFGIGGGVLLIPIFVYVFGQFGISHAVVMHLAVGTSLALVLPTSLAASWGQWRLHNLDLRYFRTWALAVIMGVVAGALVLPMVSTRGLEICFVGLLLVVALYIAFAKEGWTVSSTPPRGLWKGGAGVVVGFWSVLLGLGGGVLTTPVMIVCSVPLIHAIALSSATGVVVGFGGVLGAIVTGWSVIGRPSWALGYVDLLAWAAMLPMVMLMAPFGARTANHLRGLPLRILYALFLLAVAAYMLLELML